MTDQEATEKAERYRVVCDEIWKANAAHNASLAGSVFARHNLPPIVLSLPGVAAFLADLQKSAYYSGAVGVMHALDEADQLSMSNETPPDAAPLLQ